MIYHHIKHRDVWLSACPWVVLEAWAEYIPKIYTLKIYYPQDLIYTPKAPQL